jgi:hypothetical protein
MPTQRDIANLVTGVVLLVVTLEIAAVLILVAVSDW